MQIQKTDNKRKDMQDKPEVDVNKVKDMYTKGIVSLEIIKLKEQPKDIEEAEKMYEDMVKIKTYLVDDLSAPYMIRLAYTENKSKLKSVDPDHMDEMDHYEISETIQDIFRENNFPVIKSEFPEKPEELEYTKGDK